MWRKAVKFSNALLMEDEFFSVFIYLFCLVLLSCFLVLFVCFFLCSFFNFHSDDFIGRKCYLSISLGVVPLSFFTVFDWERAFGTTQIITDIL